jgi:hypothetical protein
VAQKNVFAMPDETQGEMLRDFGIREDQLEDQINRAQPVPLDLFSSQSSLDERRRRAEMAQKALDRLRGTGTARDAAATAGGPLSPKAAATRRNGLLAPSENQVASAMQTGLGFGAAAMRNNQNFRPGFSSDMVGASQSLLNTNLGRRMAQILAPSL